MRDVYGEVKVTSNMSYHVSMVIGYAQYCLARMPLEN